MKSLLCVLLLLIGFGAQSAGACAEVTSGAHHARLTKVATSALPTAIELDWMACNNACECPIRIGIVEAARVEGDESAILTPTERDTASEDFSIAELRRARDARSRYHSHASPITTLPPYLLTARLRR